MVLNTVKQESSTMPIIVVYVPQTSSGLLKTVNAPENVMKSLMLFPMKVQMQILVNVCKGTNGIHLLAISCAVDHSIQVML